MIQILVLPLRRPIVKALPSGSGHRRQPEILDLRSLLVRWKQEHKLLVALSSLNGLSPSNLSQLLSLQTPPPAPQQMPHTTGMLKPLKLPRPLTRGILLTRTSLEASDHQVPKSLPMPHYQTLMQLRLKLVQMHPPYVTLVRGLGTRKEQPWTWTGVRRRASRQLGVVLPQITLTLLMVVLKPRGAGHQKQQLRV